MYPQDFFLNSFLYLFTCGCTGSSLLHRLFPSCGKLGLLFIAVHGILTTVASFDFGEHRLYSAESMVVAYGMWDLPGPGIEPVSPALAGGLLTTGPPEKSEFLLFCSICSVLFMVGFFPFVCFSFGL